ncbi:hypothetical protein EMG21_27730 [Klebsiella pneumoniae]|jgi:hypothetical protein|nr:hypothetical protein EMG21_27730 [Klebsiella pneumoniae]
MFDLQSIAQNIVSQIAFIIAVIMAVRALIAYTREDWGNFFSGLILGLLCFVVVFFGPQFQNLARWIGENIFG